MRKKNIIYLTLILAASLTASSCAKPLAWTDPEGVYDTEQVEVYFSVEDGVASKATGITENQEKAVSRWAVFAFDDEDGWFRYATSDNASNIPLKLWAGRYYTCYAVTNYKLTGDGAFNPATVTSASDLMNRVARLQDQSVGNLMMFGRLPGVTPTPRIVNPEVPVDPGSDAVNIYVQRMVSKVTVTKVAVDFSEKPYLASKTFTLKGIYLTNVYKTTRFGSDYLPSNLSASRTAWYNTAGRHRGESAISALDAILEDTGINTVITESSPYNVAHSFYAIPNPTPKSADMDDPDHWGVRCTRVVMECTIDDDTVYYFVTIPAMERNMAYTMSDVVIKGRGSNDPEEKDIDPDIIEVTVTATPISSWDTSVPEVSDNA